MQKLSRSALASVALFTLVFGVFRERAANAAMMTHTDLASLALEADAVVRGKRGAATKVEQYLTITDTIITKSYKGQLAPGDHIALDYGLYALQSPFGDSTFDAGAPGNDVILFLRQNHEAKTQRQWDAGVVFDWTIESSGLRQEVGGVVQRFEQWSNPGGFAPVPQGLDPYDLSHDPRGKVTYSLATFEPELISALGRAAAVQSAMDRASTEAGKNELIELIGPSDPDDPHVPMRTHNFGFYQDDVAENIIARLAAEKDAVSTVRAVARVTTPINLNRVHKDLLPIADLARIAADKTLPIRERVAATSLMGWPHDEPLMRASILALLADPEPEIRAAAAAVFPIDAKDGDPFIATITRLFHSETDARVLLAIKQTSWNMQRPHILDGRAPHALFVTAYRAGRVVHTAWGTAADTDNRMTKVEIVATGPTTQKLVVEQKDLFETRSGGSGTASIALAFDPPLQDGKYTLTADVSVDEKGKVNTHHFTLALLTANAGAKIPTYSYDAGAEPLTMSATVASTASATHDSLDAASAQAVPPAPPESHSCAFGVLGTSDHDHSLFLGGLSIALLALVAQRRHRRAPTSRA